MKSKIVFYSAVIIVLSAFVLLFLRRDNFNEVAWEFKGPISNIIYDSDGPAFITVNKKVWDLRDVEWATKPGIEKGDTAIKLKGDKYIKFIKANTKDTTYYNKEY